MRVCLQNELVLGHPQLGYSTVLTLEPIKIFDSIQLKLIKVFYGIYLEYSMLVCLQNELVLRYPQLGYSTVST